MFFASESPHISVSPIKTKPSRETIGERSKTHGMNGTKFYRKYHSIVQRCTYPKATSYSRYGAIGIKNLWNSFEDFRDDMYESYIKHVETHGESDTTIDRIDFRGNYCKENCRWATKLEQANNKKNNHLMTYQNRTLTVAQWSKELGINVGTIHSRFLRKQPLERIFSKKKHHKNGEVKYLEYNGEKKLLKEWAKEYGIKYNTLYNRLFIYNWSIEKSLTYAVR